MDYKKELVNLIKKVKDEKVLEYLYHFIRAYLKQASY